MTNKQITWEIRRNEGHLIDTDRDDVFGGKVKEFKHTGYSWDKHNAEWTEEFEQELRNHPTVRNVEVHE